MSRHPLIQEKGLSRRLAFDPFFIFTYSLLALAGAIQLFLMSWMDVL